MEINEAIERMKALSLLDLLIRGGEVENQHGVTIGSFTPELMSLSYGIRHQMVDGDPFHDIELLSDDMEPETFINEFDIRSAEDLERITLDDLWEMYRANRAGVMLFARENSINVRIGDGVNSAEEALAYGMSYGL